MSNKLICNICLSEIHISEEPYSELRDFEKGRITNSIFMHKFCFKQRLNDLVKANDLASRYFGGIKVT